MADAHHNHSGSKPVRGTPAVVPVYKLSDLPTPGGGDLVQAANTVYWWFATIDGGANRLVPGVGTKNIGIAREVAGWVTSNATEAVFVGNGALLDMLELTITQNGAGDLIRCADATSNVFLRKLGIAGGDIVLAAVNFFDLNESFAAQIRVTGPVTDLGVRASSNSGAESGSGQIDFSAAAVVGRVGIEKHFLFIGSGQFGIKVDPAATITVAQIDKVTFDTSGGGTALDGITNNSVGWRFKDCPGVDDSTALGAAIVDSNAVLTTFPGDDIWFDIDFGGLAVLGARNARFGMVDTTRMEIEWLDTPDFSGVAMLELSGNSTNPAVDFPFRLLKSTQVSQSITGITQAAGTATANKTAHGYSVSDVVTIRGANETGYNGTITITATPDADNFEYAVDSGLASPATGTITATLEIELTDMLNPDLNIGNGKKAMALKLTTGLSKGISIRPQMKQASGGLDFTVTHASLILLPGSI